MGKHKCDAIVIHCIDFRMQKYIDAWLKKRFEDFTYDRVSVAGGIFDNYFVLKQVEISKKLHGIKKVILINHEDCGAYGRSGTYKRHIKDLAAQEKKIEALLKPLDTQAYYLHLDGTFEEITKEHPLIQNPLSKF